MITSNLLTVQWSIEVDQSPIQLCHDGLAGEALPIFSATSRPSGRSYVQLFAVG